MEQKAKLTLILTSVGIVVSAIGIGIIFESVGGAIFIVGAGAIGAAVALHDLL